MATNKEITMKQYNGVDYDTLYPKTTSDQIVDTIPLSTKTSGTLSVDRGGTGATTASSAMNNLISALSTATPDDSDLIPFKDVSGNTVGNMTVSKLAELASASGVKIQTGSYVGTGTYGSSNPCSLTFNFVPKYLIIQYGHATDDMWTGMRCYVPSPTVNGALINWVATKETQEGAYEATGGFSAIWNGLWVGNNTNFSNGNKTISWYCAGDSSQSYYQLNAANSKYFYVAIG